MSAASHQHSVRATQLFVGALLTQLACTLPLWGHESSGAVVFGRYSLNYAAVLLLHIGLTAGWLLALLRRDAVESWLQQLSARQRSVLAGAVVLAVLVIALPPIEPQIKQVAAINALLVTMLLTVTTPADLPASDRLRKILYAAAGLLLLPMLFTMLVCFPFSPDEAHWADYARTGIRQGSIYAPTWLQEPMPIVPGTGWSVAAYGWALEHIAFDIRTGRVWIFVGYLLTFAALGAGVRVLYGRRAAWISLLFVALSLTFIPNSSLYKAHLLAPIAGALLVFLTAKGQLDARQPARRLIWHALAGLVATLSLQLHAVGIAYAVGMAAFLLLRFAHAAWRQRRLFPADQTSALLGFAFGAAIGTGVYFAANILPVGGLSVYVSSLLSERLGRLTPTGQALIPPSLFEIVVVLAGYLYLAWRRNPADRLVLGLFGVMLPSFLILDTQGYRLPFAIFYYIPVGALFTAGLDGKPNTLRGLLAAAPVIALSAALIVPTIDWRSLARWLTTGDAPHYAYNDLAPQIQALVSDDDVILSTHMLIWSLPDHPNLYSAAGELTAMRRWDLTDPAEVWERVGPTVAVFLDTQMSWGEGAETYLDRHGFAPCQQFMVQTINVTVLRPECGAGN